MSIYSKLVERFSKLDDHKQLVKFATELVDHLDDEHLAGKLVRKLNDLNEFHNIIENDKVKYILMLDEVLKSVSSYKIVKSMNALDIATKALSIKWIEDHDNSHTLFTCFCNGSGDENEMSKRLLEQIGATGLVSKIEVILNERKRLADIKADELRRKHGIDRELAMQVLSLKVPTFNGPRVNKTTVDNKVNYSDHELYKAMNSCPVTGNLYPYCLSSKDPHELACYIQRPYNTYSEWLSDRTNFITRSKTFFNTIYNKNGILIHPNRSKSSKRFTPADNFRSDDYTTTVCHQDDSDDLDDLFR